MPQHKFRQTLKKLERRGIKVMEKSEKNTSKVGEKISLLVGLDVHKCSLLSVVSSNEGDGSQRRRQKRGKRADRPRPWLREMRFWASPLSGYPAIPGSWGLSFFDRLRADLPCLHVKVC